MEGRKTEFLKRSSFAQALGVPVRKRDDLPDTFSVPPPEKRKRISPKPMARARLALEPTLNETVYQEILQTIWDLGRTMERLPSTYADKDEETLRDHILLYLNSALRRFLDGRNVQQDRQDRDLRCQQGLLSGAELNP